MIRRLIACMALWLIAQPSWADERRVAIGSIDRVRVEGTFKVVVRTGASPSLTIAGGREAIEQVDARDDGGVLVIRGRGDGGRPSFAPASARREPIVVTIAAPALRGVVVIGGAVVDVDAMKAATADLSISGAGAVTIAAVEADRLAVTLIGNGSVTLGGGRAGFARLVDNGGGVIDAAALDAGDLIVHLDGVGSVKARARYTAQVIDSGLGSVSIGGAPKCTVKAAAGGPIACGGTQ